MNAQTPMLSLVMPLFNEATGVEAVVGSLCRTLEHADISYRLILVDNGSIDETGTLADALVRENEWIEVIHLSRNQGYGGGIIAGLSQARAPVTGYLWGDEQVGHYCVVDAYHRLTRENLDLCKARRVVRLDGWKRKAITSIYHGVLPLFFSHLSSDVHGCPKLFTREALERIRPTKRDWFLDAEIMIKAKRLGLSIGEIDVAFYPRETGVSKVRWGTVGEFAINLCKHRSMGFPGDRRHPL